MHTLKCGFKKLNTCLVVGLLIFVLNAHAQINSKSLCVQADFLIVIDVSGSVSSTQTKTFVDAFMKQVQRYQISDDGIRIGFVVFNSTVLIDQDFTADKNVFLQKINAIDALERGGGTNILNALHTSKSLWESSFDERKGIHRAMVLLSDGNPGRKSPSNYKYEDDDDIKVQPNPLNIFYSEREEDSVLPIGVRYELDIAQTIKTMAKTEYPLEDDIHFFTLNIATGASDAQHLEKLASPDEYNPLNDLTLKYYLGKDHQPFFDWIDGLSICN